MTVSGRTIRQLVASDIPLCREIEQAVSVQPWSPETFARGIKPKHLGEVVIVNGKVVGFCICLLVADELSILNIAVAADHQRLGLGQQLLESALHEATSQGTSEAFLEVRQSNRSAQRLYEKLGFQVAGIREHYYPATRETPAEHALLMAKTLLAADD